MVGSLASIAGLASVQGRHSHVMARSQSSSRRSNSRRYRALLVSPWPVFFPPKRTGRSERRFFLGTQYVG